jgi:hypothetical protein
VHGQKGTAILALSHPWEITAAALQAIARSDSGGVKYYQNWECIYLQNPKLPTLAGSIFN